ncbi:MAG: hypothetical protein PVI90_04690 [Desulfobacteraceae bacterium]|jgi:hypothetical protein
MRNAKEIFELGCKIVGLLLVVGGILMGIDVMLNYFLIDTETGSKIVWRRGIVLLLFQSFVPVGLGLYLMKSDNVFSEYCYPTHIVHPRPTETMMESDDDDDTLNNNFSL